LIANLQGAMKLVCHWADVRIAVRPSNLQTLREEMPNLQANLAAAQARGTGGRQRVCRRRAAASSPRAGASTAISMSQLDRVIEQVLPKGQ
jgi:hypothetical protein